MRIPSGVTDQVIYFVAVDVTDLKTRETGLTTFTVYRDRNGAGAAAMTTPTVTEVDATNMPGVYKLLLDEDMTIAAGNQSEEMCFHITQAAMAPVTRTIELYRPSVTAGETIGVSSGAVSNVTTLTTYTGNTVQTGDAFARLGAPAGASVSADIAAVKTDTAAILVDTGTTLDGRIPAALVGGRMDCNVGAISADATAADNLEIWLDQLITGAVSDVTPAANNFDTNLTSATDSFYIDRMLVFTSGTLTGQMRSVYSYIGATKTVTFDEVFTSAPANGDTFALLPIHVHPITDIAAQTWVNATRTLTAATNITSTGGTTVPQTGDSYARIGAPAGADISADIAAVKSDTAAILTDTGTTLDTAVTAIKTQTDKFVFTVANQVDANIQYVNDVQVTGDGQAGTEWGP